MKWKFRILSFAMLSISAVNGYAQNLYPKTLLWRITGNGLQKPSYLYGTIHLQDKKLFYFTDSLYNAISSTDGFAMEIDPEEMMDSVIMRYGEDDNSPLFKNTIDKKLFNKVSKQLEKKYKVSADKLTIKQIIAARRAKIYEQKSGDKMPTFMDIYLYNIAQKQGKWTGGIEDVGDQMSLVDEWGSDIKTDDVIKDDDKLEELIIDRMKRIYIDQNLSAMDSFFKANAANLDNNYAIIKRNKKMARRIDSIAALRSCFFAIGTAHLPGDSGVITLLRKRGFTVEPVLSNNKIAPENYSYSPKEKIWVKVSDDNNAYTVEMPGTPTQVNIEKVLPLKLYVDLNTLTTYGSAVIASEAEDSAISKRMKKLIDYYESTGYSFISKKTVELDQTDGYEITLSKEDKQYLKLSLLQYQNSLFMLIYSCQVKDSLTSLTADKFFQSFRINKTPLNYYSQWKTFTDSATAFSILLPGKPMSTNFKQTDESGDVSKSYSSYDLKEGSYYIIVVNELSPYFVITSDTETFSRYKRVFENEGATNIETDTVKVNGYPACKYNMIINKDKVDYNVQALLIIRSARSYLLNAITAKEKRDFPEITNFMRSFTMLPYDTSGWQITDDSAVGFKTFSPGAFKERIDTSATADTTYRRFYVKDNNSGQGFIIDKEPFSKFYWANNDSVYWQDLTNTISNQQDSLITFSSFKGDNFIAADYLINVPDKKLKKRMRYVITGDSSYCIYTFLTDELLNNMNIKKMFNDFTVTKIFPLTIFKSKAAQLLAALNSTDSLENDMAYNVLRTANFSKEDLPLLYDAVLKNYKSDSVGNMDTNESIAYDISRINDTSVISFAEQHYNTLPDNELPIIMLGMLANQHTERSYIELKKLLAQKLPAKKIGYYLENYLNDSLSLSASLYPEAGSYFADTVLGPCFVRVANKLIDSNYLQLKTILKDSTQLYHLANHQLPDIKNADDFDDNTEDVIELLGKYNTPEATKLLYQFAGTKNITYKDEAILALLKNGLPVNPATIYAVAADTSLRYQFYDELKKIGKENLFPLVYKNQQKFAESYLYNSFSDEDEEGVIGKLTFIKEKIIDSSGTKKHYFIFKVSRQSDDDKKIFSMAVCGPFSDDKNNFNPGFSNVKTWMDYKDDFNVLKMDEQFKQFLTDIEQE